MRVLLTNQYGSPYPGRILVTAEHLQHWFLSSTNIYNISMERLPQQQHLNDLLRIFFVSGVFQNFDVDFWPLLNAEKVIIPSRFWREIFFLENFIIYHPYESINL